MSFDAFHLPWLFEYSPICHPKRDEYFYLQDKLHWDFHENETILHDLHILPHDRYLKK